MSITSQSGLLHSTDVHKSRLGITYDVTRCAATMIVVAVHRKGAPQDP